MRSTLKRDYMLHSVWWYLLLCSLVLASTPHELHAEKNQQDSTLRLELEAGAAWVPRNDVQVPNDSEGTRFAIDELDTGPYPAGRIALEWDPWKRHGFKLLLAPLQYEESGVFAKDIRFQGKTFAAGNPVNASYRFNSYRFGYRYTFFKDSRWKVRAGLTAKVRDAKIELSDDTTSSRKTDIGVVPLITLRADYRMNDSWLAVFDSEALAAPQGRAVDIALLARHTSDSPWDVSFGYRLLDGGADNDTVYTFAQIHYVVFQLGYRLP